MNTQPILALPAPSLARHLARTIDGRSLTGIEGAWCAPAQRPQRSAPAPEPQFFFGGTSRPIMIKLSHDFTLYSAEFGDCTGLTLMRDDLDAHAGLTLRDPHEVRGLANWLRSLNPPNLNDGETKRVERSIPGFSPDYEDESIPADGAFSGYDATELRLWAVWRRDDRDDGLCLHLASDEDDGLDVQGVPARLLPALFTALEKFAHEWDTNGIDLTLEEPLAHIPAP